MKPIVEGLRFRREGIFLLCMDAYLCIILVTLPIAYLSLSNSGWKGIKKARNTH